MIIHLRCFRRRRLPTSVFARLLLGRHTDLVEKQIIDLRADVIRSIVSLHFFKCRNNILII